MRLPEWLVRPETILAIGLFFVSVLVSLYAEHIRRGLKVPGRFIQDWSLNGARIRLTELERIHNNSYELLLFLTAELATIVVGCFRITVLYLTVALLGALTHVWKVQGQSFVWLPGMLAGIAVARLYWIWKILSGLDNFQNTIEKLKARLEKASVRP